MSRRKLGVWEQAIRDAAKLLGEPKDSFVVEKYATLATLLKLHRSQWAQGKASNSADMIAVMSELEAMRRERGKDAITEIKVHVVESLKARCPHCGQTSDIPPEMVQKDSRNTHAEPSDSNPAPKTASPPTYGLPNGSESHASGEPAPAKAEPVVTYREGVSASAFHSAVLNGHEVPPLKSRQPSPYTVRKLSPMSH
jgi:hypothetical protein